MLSKCANPECFEVFRYLHQGKIFHLLPMPEVHAAAEVLGPLIYERFWLCDTCSKHMTVVWGGTHAKLVRLPLETEPQEPLPVFTASDTEAPEHEEVEGHRGQLRAGFACAGGDDG
jgi:hypothetical protein